MLLTQWAYKNVSYGYKNSNMAFLFSFIVNSFDSGRRQPAGE